MLANTTVGGSLCPRWLYLQEWPNKTTIVDINNLLMTRNIPGLVFVSFLMLTGIFGNSTVLYIFWTRFARSNYRTYVLCLGIIDEISSCILMPFIILYLTFPKYFPNNGLCKFGHFIGYYTSVTSAFLLILIAIDRYRKICQPLKKQISKTFAKRSCIVINTVGLLISIQAPIIYGTSTRSTGIYDIKETICFMEDVPLLRNFGKAFYIQLQVCLILVIVFLTVLYYRIMQKLYVHRRESVQRLSSLSSGSKTVRTRKTTLTFIVITVIFTLSSEIHHVLAIILHFVDNLECYMNKYEGAAFYLFLWSVFINNVTNPFIYGVSDERFRRYIKEIFGGKENNYTSKETVRSKSSLTE